MAACSSDHCFSGNDRLAESSSADTTQLLRAWAGGDRDALPQLTARVYRELRILAAHFLHKERPGYTLQSAELVHEVYLRLVDANQVNWQDRAHFFAVAATLMRRILVDRARRRSAGKRGAQVVNLDNGLELYAIRARELIALDDALSTLAQVDPRRARIVELRFFAGLSVEETAEVVKLSSDTVTRDWKLARAWLLKELRAQG
jgi:RNA polymerase sigma factor (TIGR02999 family)